MQVVNEYANILLIDFDGPVNPYPQIIQQAYEQGSEVVLYSHGAPVITAWDGIWKPGPLTRLYLAQSLGQKCVMMAYKYPYPIEVIGWHYCEQRVFQPRVEVKKILFAPEHPHLNGYITAKARELNTKVYNDLLSLPFQLTVRHFGPLSMNGLKEHEGVQYQQSDMILESSVKAIDEADVVISNPGTFGCLAVARGKPMVMIGQNICPRDGYSDATLQYVKHWDDYREYMRYPYDISTVKPKIVEYIIRSAGTNEAVDWRDRFIGHTIDPEALVDILKGI